MWLYNSAGWAYARVDDREALRWLHQGIDVAIATGDPDQVIGQLLGMAQDVWDRLGDAHDVDLVQRVESFQRDWVQPVDTRSWPDPPSNSDAMAPCSHCGFEPEPLLRPAMRAPRAPRPPKHATEMQLSLAWFPADEWPAAVERWPHLADDFPTPHDEYSHRIEARMKWLARHVVGHRLSISPLRVDELIATEGDEAGTGQGRSHFAAEIARTGRALSWPPSRNDPCWCGSGVKYKRCCGPVPPAEDT